MRRRGIDHTCITGSQLLFSLKDLSAKPNQWFSGVSPDPLTDSDPRS